VWISGIELGPLALDALAQLLHLLDALVDVAGEASASRLAEASRSPEPATRQSKVVSRLIAWRPP
jgi:hypothetical protein